MSSSPASRSLPSTAGAQPRHHFRHPRQDRASFRSPTHQKITPCRPGIGLQMPLEGPGKTGAIHLILVPLLPPAQETAPQIVQEAMLELEETAAAPLEEIVGTIAHEQESGQENPNDSYLKEAVRTTFAMSKVGTIVHVYVLEQWPLKVQRKTRLLQ
ncbi:hypothetical protein BDN70DRAFT_902209 [Pholiota conissans]|uniref:Uncharacterized protein n=1 Tax=Pholiota conissans TaxID=109636 RepID=A0A9P5YM23_9AGAR|nr:hypothetical protein BDN70DRAFT_902209 [Pholiota conissans]